MAAVHLLIVALLTFAQVSDLKAPVGWKIRLDRPGFVSSDPYFVTMAPGWQISTDSPVIAYDTTRSARGNYKLESEILLFPGSQTGGFGLFIGGAFLDSNEVTYSAFQIRRDGKFSIWSRKGPTTRELVAWTANPAILPLKGETEPVKNLIGIEIRPSEIAFLVNGKTVYLSSRTALSTDGNFGFHVGEMHNIHANTLILQNLN